MVKDLRWKFWKKWIEVFGNFFLLMICIQLIQILLNLPTYDFSYLVILTVLLTIGDCVAIVRFFCFGVTFFLLDLSPGIILVPIALFVLKFKDYNLVCVLISKVWILNSQKNMA